jgi:hypothetical protein
VAIDDNRALNRAFPSAGLGSTRIEIIRTPDVIVGLLHAGVLTVKEADRIKETWVREHRFTIKTASFADLL